MNYLSKLQFKLYSIALKLKQEMAIWNLSIVSSKINLRWSKLKQWVYQGLTGRGHRNISQDDKNVLHFEQGDCYTEIHNTYIKTHEIVQCLSLYINFNSPKKVKYTHAFHNPPDTGVPECTCRYRFCLCF